MGDAVVWMEDERGIAASGPSGVGEAVIRNAVGCTVDTGGAVVVVVAVATGASVGAVAAGPPVGISVPTT